MLIVGRVRLRLALFQLCKALLIGRLQLRQLAFQAGVINLVDVVLQSAASGAACSSGQPRGNAGQFFNSLDSGVSLHIAVISSRIRLLISRIIPVRIHSPGTAVCSGRCLPDTGLNHAVFVHKGCKLLAVGRHIIGVFQLRRLRNNVSVCIHNRPIAVGFIVEPVPDHVCIDPGIDIIRPLRGQLPERPVDELRIDSRVSAAVVHPIPDNPLVNEIPVTVCVVLILFDLIVSHAIEVLVPVQIIILPCVEPITEIGVGCLPAAKCLVVDALGAAVILFQNLRKLLVLVVEVLPGLRVCRGPGFGIGLHLLADKVRHAPKVHVYGISVVPSGLLIVVAFPVIIHPLLDIVRRKPADPVRLASVSAAGVSEPVPNLLRLGVGILHSELVSLCLCLCIFLLQGCNLGL